MAMADDDYRKRLANRMMQGTEATSNPMGAAYARGFGYLGDFIKDTMNPFMRLPEDIAKGDKGAVALTIGSAAMGGKGKGPNKATLAALRSKALQDAVKAAEEFAGTKFADEVIGQGTMKASDMPRYAQAGGQKFLDFIEEQLASGAMDVKSANRFVRAFPEYLSGSGADAAYEIVGRNARAFEDLTTKADDALVEMQFAKEGLSKGTRKYGPKTLAEHLLSKLPEAQARVYGVLDEWY